MKLKNKLAILFAALLLTFIGFNLMASPSALGLFDLERVLEYDVYITVTAEAAPSTAVYVSG